MVFNVPDGMVCMYYIQGCPFPKDRCIVCIYLHTKICTLASCFFASGVDRFRACMLILVDDLCIAAVSTAPCTHVLLRALHVSCKECFARSEPNAKRRKSQLWTGFSEEEVRETLIKHLVESNLHYKTPHQAFVFFIHIYIYISTYMYKCVYIYISPYSCALYTEYGYRLQNAKYRVLNTAY